MNEWITKGDLKNLKGRPLTFCWWPMPFSLRVVDEIPAGTDCDHTGFSQVNSPKRLPSLWFHSVLADEGFWGRDSPRDPPFVFWFLVSPGRDLWFPLGYCLMPSGFAWGPCAWLCICAQLCLTLCDPMARLSVHGILQARILECVAISYSRRYSWSRDRAHISYVSFLGRQVTPGKPSWGQAELLFWWD